MYASYHGNELVKSMYVAEEKEVVNKIKSVTCKQLPLKEIQAQLANENCFFVSSDYEWHGDKEYSTTKEIQLSFFQVTIFKSTCRVI